MSTKPRKTATQHGGSTIADLQQALEEYLPVLLGLVENGNQLQDKLQFSWLNQEDDAEVGNQLHLSTTQAIDSYSCSSIFSGNNHVKFLVRDSLSFANDDHASAIPSQFLDPYENIFRRLLLKSIRRKDLPMDLAEGVLRAFCLQALGQGVDIQLGMAIDSVKATLAVKRRFACELVKYWRQAQQNIVDLPLANVWGEKHKLFIRWKFVEAKAAAYYFHGLILDEGKTEGCNEMAMAALKSADEFLKESKKACESFHATPPLSQ